MAIADHYGRMAARSEPDIQDGRWNWYGVEENEPLMPVKSPDPVNDNVFRPSHYASKWPEPITIVNAWGLNFNKGNALKYIARAGAKNPDPREDLKKAIRYLEIELECLDREDRIINGREEKADVWSNPL